MEANTDGAGSRRMETVALRYSQGKKRKKKTHTALCFCCFSFTLWKTHHGDITGEHAGAQPLGVVQMCWGGFLFLLGQFHTLSAGPAAG